MTVNPARVRQVMRYAVAVASSAEENRRRELGPIHLVKYVYLADLSHAEEHGGETYTGIPWRFHHYGPWSKEAWKQIESAMDLPAIRRRSFRGRYQDDVSRWQSEDPELEERSERDLPLAVAQDVRGAVREFANDTSGLLHHVYRTPPMLRAAPHERLDFSTAVVAESEESVVREAAREPRMSPTRRKEAHDALRVRFQALLKKGLARSRRLKAPPRENDEDFVKVQEWVDSLAGEPIRPMEGELIVSEAIWKSPTRSEPSIP